MDYKRTRHWAKYDSDKCKMYLRNDFHFECAYCRMREQDNAAGEKIFEKDHFISKKTESRQDLMIMITWYMPAAYAMEQRQIRT